MSNEVANTILAQLGGRRFIAMTGSSNFLGDTKSLTFKVGRNAYKVTHVRITLNVADLYDIEWLNVRAGKIKQAAQSSFGIYADMLQAEFTRVTGMATHL